MNPFWQVRTLTQKDMMSSMTAASLVDEKEANHKKHDELVGTLPHATAMMLSERE